MNTSQAIPALAAMAEETRLELFRRIVRAGEAGSSAGDLAKMVDASPSRTSFHLSALAKAGLIHATKKSRHVIYTADFLAIGELMRFLLEDCCANRDDVRACCGITKIVSRLKNQ